ncbi:hypothetical protein CLV30_104289 [Haloactinopolyspora alba]|uniref:TadE-like protein n=2 Tax=Haloactinopolyspora alba TaxID=648780 RepID=A0A2P8E7H7_9ACTN|nr:TadE family type IV pilus minor pilin [Haloactinopolyspora alba]PSL05419.1 hypothetical protein CLV30_104289 [Haloactinopolyspora alba]
MVTAEIATALPALALVLVAAVWTVVFASAQLRCADAAREAARAAARGETAAVVRQVAAETAPDGADISVDRTGGRVVVEVSAAIAMPGPVGDSVPAPTAQGRAVALTEIG